MVLLGYPGRYRGSLLGYPGGYIPYHTLPVPLVAILPRVYIASLLLPGYTTLMSHRPQLLATCAPLIGGEEKSAWAHPWDIPWVRASCCPSCPKGVMREGGLCAELFRSSGEESYKDWIHIG